MNIQNKKCPVCGNPEVRKAGTYGDQLQCTLCGTTDNAQQFPSTETASQLSARAWSERCEYIPPVFVVGDVPLLRPVFVADDPPRLGPPTMTLDQVRALASAFRCDLMPRITTGRCEEIARKVCDRIGPGWAFADADEKTTCFALVRLVAEELRQAR